MNTTGTLPPSQSSSQTTKKNSDTMMNSYSMSIYSQPTQESPPAKKRGRKKKQKEEFVEMEEYTFGDTTYLIDTQNNVYTFDIEAPRLIGERFVDGTIHLFPVT
jgi:glycogen synthase